MKKFIAIVAAMTAAASLATGVQAETAPAAVEASPWSFYGTAGYNYLHASPYNVSVDLGAVTGRIGARYDKYIGAEAEVSVGVVDQNIAGATISLDNEYAAYLVGYLPVSPKGDLFARVGYGSARLKGAYAGTTATASGDVWALGAGGQYFITDKDGIRAEYTRYASTDSSESDVDSFTVSYVRKF